MMRTPSIARPSSACTAREDHAPKRPANDNACSPIVVLTPIGDGFALARALARVLVRRELILVNVIPDSVHCKDQREAG